jgi:hypothetical protein
MKNLMMNIGDLVKYKPKYTLNFHKNMEYGIVLNIYETVSDNDYLIKEKGYEIFSDTGKIIFLTTQEISEILYVS